MPATALIETLVQALQWLTTSAGASLLTACSALSEQAAAVAVTAVWQGAVVACGLAICLRLAPRTSAEHRFAIWAAAFVTLAILPFVSLFTHFSATVAIAGSVAGQVGVARPWLSIDNRWSLLIALLWATASLYRAGDLAVHSFRLRRLWRDAIPVDIEELGASAGVTKVALKRGPFQICTTNSLQRPSVIGFFKPRILIPGWLYARLTPGELEQIVLHEAEHLRRNDDWTNLFQKLCLILFPLNPALAWIERRMCREREMACDDGVIEITNAPRAYASCLTSLAERGLERRAEALSLGAWQRRPELVHRVHAILRRKRRLGPVGTRALLGAMGCSLLLGSIELARCPQLITFVPERNQNSDLSGAKLVAQADSQAASGRLMKTAYVPVWGAGAGSAVPEFRETRLKAVMPAGQSAELGHARMIAQGNAVKQDVAVAGKSPSYKPNAQAPRPVLLRADLQDSQTAKAQVQPIAEQQWIVLTTWEQVQTSDQSAGLRADYETGASANAASDASAQTSAPGTADKNIPSRPQPGSQITVTRLLLKIYPASSISTQPGASFIRGGWLVIQL